jgi:hypothetical protein
MTALLDGGPTATATAPQAAPQAAPQSTPRAAPTARPKTATAAPDAAFGADAVGIAPVAVRRVNLLRRTDLTPAADRAEVRRLLDAETARQHAAVALGDALTAAVPQVDADVRRLLLRLRRDVFNGRPARPAGGWTHPTLTAYQEADQSVQRHAATVQAGADAGLDAARAAVRRLLADDDFARTVDLASRSVGDRRAKYVAHGQSPTHADLRSERGLLQYLTRALLRTSPAGRFTGVGVVLLGSGLPLERAADPRVSEIRLQLDRSAAHELVAAAHAAQGLRTVAAGPGLTWTPSTLQYTRRRGERLERVSLARTRPVLVAVTALGAGPLPVTVLVGRLVEHAGLEPAQAVTLLRTWVATGLLVPGSPIDPFHDDPLGAYVADLPAPSGSAPLVELDAALRTAQGADGPAVTTLRDRLAGAVSAAGLPLPARLDEDTRLAPVAASLAGHEAAAADLVPVTRFLSLFDWMHNVRALLARAFVDRYGAGATVPLLTAAQTLVEMVERRERQLDSSSLVEFGPADGSLLELDRLRRAATALVDDAFAAAAATGAPAALLDPAALAAFTAQAPNRFLARPRSYTVLVQTVGDGFVWNDAFPGGGNLLTRFLPADADGDAARALLRRELARRYGPAADLRELVGVFGDGVNVHPPVLERTLGAAEIGGLRLAHDPDLDEVVVLGEDGTPVVPLHLGGMWNELMPAPVKLLTWTTLPGRLVPDFAAGWARRHTAGGQTLPVPALRSGGVLLARRRWVAGVDLAAALAPTGDGARLAAVTRWRARHGVPEQIVLKTPLPWNPADPTWDASPDVAGRSGQQRNKPQWVDLCSPLLLRALPTWLARRDDGVIEEALPDLGAADRAVEWGLDVDTATAPPTGPRTDPASALPAGAPTGS